MRERIKRRGRRRRWMRRGVDEEVRKKIINGRGGVRGMGYLCEG